MATLRDIRRRIRSVQSTQKITRAMKLVAAAKLRRAQERILSARPYAGKMAELLGEPRAARTEAPAHPLLEQREGPRRAARHHHGRQGPVRRLQLERHPPARWRSCASSAAEVTLVVGGQEGPRLLPPPGVRRSSRDMHRLLGSAGLQPRRRSWPTSSCSSTSTARWTRSYLLYNEFRSVAMQRPVRVQLLPIPHAEVEAGRRSAAGGLHLRAEPARPSSARCCRAT